MSVENETHPDNYCGVSCPRALHWRWSHPKTFRNLRTDYVFKVHHGDVIMLQRWPEFVVQGNASPGSAFKTINRAGQTKTRSFPEHIPIIPSMCANRK